MSDLAAPEKKSWIENFVAKARGDIAQAPPATPASYLKEGGSTAVDYGVAGLVGGLLGAAHAKWNVGSKAAGIVAGAGALASIGLSGHLPQAAQYARKAGSQAFGIFTFLEGFKAVKHEPLPGGDTPSVVKIPAPGTGPGVHGEDPIEAAAKGLG